VIQKRLTSHLEEKQRQTTDKELLRKLKRVANMFTIQYALLWYIYLKNQEDQVTFQELYRAYRYLSEKLTRRNTVLKQLQMLERKGLIERHGDRYYCLVDPRDVEDLFDIKRSRSGKIGATLRHMKIASKSLKISPGLAYYMKRVIDEARKLIAKGKRAVALDLLVHTLLPLRENEILWLWYGDTFIYYIKKTRSGKFRAVKSKEVAELLRRLGYSEGIMIIHTLGHKEASKIIKRIFSRGPYSWPWARSVSYGLKYLGLLEETTNFKIQLKKLDNEIEAWLWDLYTKELLAQYTIKWEYETPEPLKNKQYVIATVLGKQHIKKEIEENSYFSKWRH